MKLTKSVKQKIYESLPRDYIAESMFMYKSKMRPEGKSHKARAAWWAEQADGFLFFALHEDEIQLELKVIKKLAKLVGCKLDKDNDDYPEDQQQNLSDFITGSFSFEELHEIHEMRIAKSEDEEVEREPGEPTVEELWEEAERLAKPVLHLKALKKPKSTNKRCAVWTYKGKFKDDSRVWGYFDLRNHPNESLRAKGILQIVEWVDPRRFEITFLSGKRLPVAKRGQKNLYGVKAMDLPHPDTLMAKAKKSIKKWAEKIEGDQLVEYETEWMAVHPSEAFHGDDVYLQLGGWPRSWPDESAENQLRKKLVLRTYEGSEPWLEVFKKGKGYSVVARIT